MTIAREISHRIKYELGVTVSIGTVSYTHLVRAAYELYHLYD